MSDADVNTTIGTATVMFTDLVGSTEMRSRVGEDVAEVLRATHDEVISTAVAAHGGQVVKHLGDGMMATFASAAGAVAASVAMQQDLDVRNRRSDGERMEIRVGISIGDVTFDGDDCFGLPVVEAQRLEASAEPSTIRCAEMVMLMARGRGGHEFVQLGELDLKGLGAPLAACEVRWSPIAEPDEPTVELGLPPVFAHGRGLPFAGRDDVFEQLVDAWKRCVTGGFEVVLLAGEPGIGKTRLAQELALRIQGGDGMVLGGRSDEDVTVPFQAFGAALDWSLRQVPPEERLDALGEYPGDLVRLVPELGRLVVDLPAALDDDPDVERYRLFQAVDSWLSVGGVDRPRLLVLDDLHWADKPTLLLLRHLISNPPVGLMILCTYRDTDVDRTHPLSTMLADFRRMPAVSRIALDGLGDEGVRDLLIRTGGHDLDDIGLAFAERVQRETSGNPFFLGEVLRHLTETGALYERDGRWVSDLSPDDAGIPEGIREVVGRRLSRLGEAVEAVLRSAAVIGYEFDVDLLADVVGKDADEVLDALDAATAANLVIEVGVDRHRFAHALVRETLHGELSSSRRARQHRKVAEALEARHADNIDPVVSELATHWAEASAGGDPTRAIELAIRAGDLASERGAYENAATWFIRTIELIEDEPAFDADRRRVLVRLAESQSESGSTAEARANALLAARNAAAAGDVGVACDALAVVSRSSFVETDESDPEKIELLGEVLAMDELTTAQRALLLAQLATEYIFVRDIAARRQAQAELIEMLPALSDEDLGPVFAVAGTFSWQMDHAAAVEGTAMARRAAHASAPTPAGRTWGNLFYWALSAGDRAVAEESVGEFRRRAAGSTNRFSAFAHMSDSMLRVMDGDLAAATQSMREMDAAMRAIELPESANYHTSTRLMIRRELGEVGQLGYIADAAEQLGHPAGSARAIAAFIRLHQGDLDASAAALDLVRGEEFSDDPGAAVVVALWSEIAIATRALDMCRYLASETAHKSGYHLATGGIYFGSADRVRALLHDSLGDHDLADDLFTSAVGQHEAIGSPTWVARTELDWAESLLARERAGDALAHAERARRAIGSLDLPDSQHRLDDITAGAANA
jgi:class 3 adenylate cyclase/tetratricopeptide (TPR) repeat protein